MSDRRFYVLFSLGLFTLGVLILLTDGFGSLFVRGFVGDVIVVMFLYAVLGAVTNLSPNTRKTVVMLVALLTEFAQLLRLQTGNRYIDEIVIGTAFDMLDVAAYGIGLALTYGIDKLRLYFVK